MLANESHSQSASEPVKRSRVRSGLEIADLYENPLNSPMDEMALRLNLPVMKLLHHFQTFTCESLLFGPEIYRLGVIPLAVEVSVMRMRTRDSCVANKLE